MFRRFIREFSYHDKDLGGRRRIPSGWSGELDDAVAKAADKAGVTAKPVEIKESKALLAARKAVTEAEAKAASATTDAEKALSAEALTKARTKLAEVMSDEAK